LSHLPPGISVGLQGNASRRQYAVKQIPAVPWLCPIP
jgi:hypothetical protein